MGAEEYQRDLELVRSRKNDFLYLYPLIFQEYLYTLAHDYSFKRVGILASDPQMSFYDTKLSFLIIKRLITRMYEQNHLIITDNDSKQNLFLIYNNGLYSQILLEGFVRSVEIPFSIQFLLSLGNSEILKLQNLQSIHSVFPFLEDKFPHLNYASMGFLPYPIHLEKMVQIVRYWLNDPSSLHLLRLFLHECRNWNNPVFPNPTNPKRNGKLFVFLYNSYIYEYESIFFFLRIQFFHLRSKSFQILFERIYFYGKVENFTEVFSNTFQVTLQLIKDPHMQYFRYCGCFLFAYKGTSLIMKKLKYYFVNLFQCHFFVWVQPEKIYLHLVDKSFFCWGGYLSNVDFNSSVIRSQMLENSFLIKNTMKKLDTRVPTSSLIKWLNEMKFCTKLGYPVSKATWANLSDSDLIDRFLHIWGILSHYFRGSSNKKSLYQVKYILRFSCLRTLARKHKTPLRAVLNSQDSFEEFDRDEAFLITFPGIYQKLNKAPLWYLDMILVDGYLFTI